MKNPTWNKLSWKHAPTWLKNMLIDVGARVATDSDCIMWYFENRVLQIEVDKLLFYAKDNPLQHRKYYEENFEVDPEEHYESILDTKEALFGTR